MTTRQRTVWMIGLSALAWTPIALWNLRVAQDGHFFVHGYEPVLFWWRLAFIDGGIVALASIGLFVSGIKLRHVNFAQAMAAIAAVWFLVEWVPVAIEGLLRSWKLVA